ncbi:MAG: hypothetical protein EAY75_07490 [Bacteroidetes bacterium]|nr:MAG: hypothetical protein EAY75_07490 [Bacteroidota bacterium]
MMNPTMHPAPYQHLMQQLPPDYARTLHLYEYKLVLPLPNALKARVMAARQRAADIVPHNTAYKVPCHMALANFATWEMLEDKLLHKLSLVCHGTTPFFITLHNYGTLPGKNIHIVADPCKPLTRLVGSLRALQPLMKGGAYQAPYFAQAPQVALATRLLPWQQEALWACFERRQFNAQFVGNHLLLLKRAAGTLPWQICKRLDFENLPSAVVQPSLFGAAA